MVRLPERMRPLFPYLKPAYSVATLGVAPLATRLSGLQGGYLPRRTVSSMEDAAAHNGRIYQVRPASVIERALPEEPKQPHPLIAENVRDTVDRVALLELDGGRVLGPEAAVITADGALVDELSRYFGTGRARQHPLYWHPFPPPPVHVPGRLGVLATRGDRNYYHFLCDVLPRLAIAEECPEIEVPDRWYVPQAYRFQRELLDLAGIRQDQRIDSGVTPHVVADTLVVPGLPSTTVRTPPWVGDFLRRRLIPEPIARVPGRGIYLTRGSARNNRTVRNEAEVVAALMKRGFSVFDPGTMSVADQITAFAEASVIVAPHGAALANLCFCGPGATVIELFPAGYPNLCYWILAAGVPGLRYQYLMGLGRQRVHNITGFIVADIDIDVPALSRMVDDILTTRTY